MKEKLSRPQKDVLRSIGAEWARAPLWAMSGTLTCLERKGLIEKRPTPGHEEHAPHVTHASYAWQWRLKQ